jgi:hypothetical protein
LLSYDISLDILLSLLFFFNWHLSYNDLIGKKLWIVIFFWNSMVNRLLLLFLLLFWLLDILWLICKLYFYHYIIWSFLWLIWSRFFPKLLIFLLIVMIRFFKSMLDFDLIHRWLKLVSNNSTKCTLSELLLVVFYFLDFFFCLSQNSLFSFFNPQFFQLIFILFSWFLVQLGDLTKPLYMSSWFQILIILCLSIYLFLLWSFSDDWVSDIVLLTSSIFWNG